MEFSKLSSVLVPAVLVIALATSMLMLRVDGQISSPCNPSMLSSFTPCMNFLTNSSANGTSSPTADCCNSLKNLTNGGLDCLCLIVTGSVPFQIPINRTLAISLPRACNMPGVPLRCKAAPGAPIPAPGPTSLAPTLSPASSPSLSPTGTIVPEPTPSAEAPESDTTPALTPPSSTGGSSEAPTASTGSRPVLTPSAAKPSYTSAPFFVILSLGFVVFKNYYVPPHHPPCRGGTATAPPPSPPQQPGCVAELVAFSPCLPYVSAPPNNATDFVAPQCCSAFSTAFESSDGYCFCYILRQPSIFGFPLNKSRVASLSSFCTVKNGTSLDSLFSSGVVALPTLPSTTESGRSKPSNSGSDNDSSASTTFSPPEPAVRSPKPPYLSAEPTVVYSATNQIYKQRCWFLLGMMIFLLN